MKIAKKCLHYFQNGDILLESLRGVAQFGRALRSGRRGRKFESCRLDSLQLMAEEMASWSSG